MMNSESVKIDVGWCMFWFIHDIEFQTK